MRRNYQANTAIFLIALILSMPFCVSDALAFNLFGDSEYEGTYGSSTIDSNIASYINNRDVAEQCVTDVEEEKNWIAELDSGIISDITDVAMLIYYICSVFTSVHSILTILYQVIGREKGTGELPGCCLIEYVPVYGEVLAKLCDIYGKFYSFWNKFYQGTVGKFCCYYLCSWCSGKSCGEYKFGISGDKNEDIKQPEASSDLLSKDAEGSKIKSLLSMGGIDPFSNIYFSIVCLCIPGVLYNIRKLSLIYKTHSCCQEESCKRGLSKYDCDVMLDYNTCMFFEGGLYIGLIKVLYSIIAKYILSYLLKYIFTKIYQPKCYVLTLFEIINIPSTLTNLMDMLDKMMTTFDEPSCSDLMGSVGRDPPEEVEPECTYTDADYTQWEAEQEECGSEDCIILDDVDTDYVVINGSTKWFDATGGYYGGTGRYSSKLSDYGRSPDQRATYFFGKTGSVAAGNYLVCASFKGTYNRPSCCVKYEIIHNGKLSIVSSGQQNCFQLSWKPLGTFDFSGDKDEQVTVNPEEAHSHGSTGVDAVKLCKVS